MSLLGSALENKNFIVVAKSKELKFTSCMNQELNDEQLILQYAKGDAAAFELLYQKHKGGLFRYCLRQFSSRALAEECFQDVWMKVVRNRENYKPQALFTTYLYRIATNQVIDLYRKEKKRHADCEYEEEHLNQNVNSSDSSLVEKEQNDESIKELRRQIRQLPFEQRNTLLLKIDGGLSLEEIAHILDCGKETVKSRLRYATNKLKELMKVSLGVEKNE